MIEIIAGAFLLLFAFWTVGYFANALYGYHFEIRSCWDGFATLGGAGVLSMIKYVMDSWKNSEQGCRPYDDTKMIQKGGTHEEKRNGQPG